MFPCQSFDNAECQINKKANLQSTEVIFPVAKNVYFNRFSITVYLYRPYACVKCKLFWILSLLLDV